MERRNRSGWELALGFVLLLAAGWIVLTAIQVFNAMEAGGAGGFIGQTPVGGVIGLLVMLSLLALLFVIYGEVSESEPGPQSFPPQR